MALHEVNLILAVTLMMKDIVVLIHKR